VAKREKFDQDDEPEGLTHNPFAALRSKGAESSGSSEPAPAAKRAEPRHEEDEPRSSGGPRLVVRREKKGRGGKTVTRVSGLPRATDLAGLARDMKKALGCGASVEEGDVLLQGALTDRAAAWLRKRLGAHVTIGN
jgi:translation initiation factor 1